MTINELRDNDLRQIIQSLHKSYTKDFDNLEDDYQKWAVRGEPIKVDVLNNTRGLCLKAERNIGYLEMLLAHYKCIGYMETAGTVKILCEEKLFYESERSRLLQLKNLLPYVKPLAQLRSKGGK